KIFLRGKYLSNQAKSVGVAHYEHLEVGYNYTMNILGAGLGVLELEKLHKRIGDRRIIFANYREKIKSSRNITFLEENEFSFSNRWLSTVRFAKHLNVKNLSNCFSKRNIEVRFLWKPMHT